MRIINDQEFEEIIKKSSKPIVADFFATWCPPCKVLGPIMEKVSEEYKDKIEFVKIDLDQCPNTGSAYGVDKIPTIFFLVNGQVKSSFVGFREEADIKLWLDDNLSKQQDKINKINELRVGYEKYAAEKGIALNSNDNIVSTIISGLLKREEEYGEKYCPCRKVTGNKEEDKKIICPCIYHLDEINSIGHCHCNLFVKKP